MKKKIRFIGLILLFICSNCLIYSQRKFYKYVKPSIDISKMRTRKIESNIYSDEKTSKEYIKFLLDNKLLNIDNSLVYSICLHNNDTTWHVLLYLSEKHDENVILDYCDVPLMYSFYLDKKNGAVTDLRFILEGNQQKQGYER